MQNEFKADFKAQKNLGGATIHSNDNRQNLGVSATIPQRSFVISEKTARLLSFCLELDMLVEELGLVVEDITNDETYIEKIAMDACKMKDIILTRFLVPSIEMSLGEIDNLRGDTIVI